MLVLVLAFTHLTIKCSNGIDKKGYHPCCQKHAKSCAMQFAKSFKLHDFLRMCLTSTGTGFYPFLPLNKQ